MVDRSGPDGCHSQHEALVQYDYPNLAWSYDDRKER
jgi:hypothetical protein